MRVTKRGGGGTTRVRSFRARGGASEGERGAGTTMALVLSRARILDFFVLAARERVVGEDSGLSWSPDPASVLFPSFPQSRKDFLLLPAG